MNKGILYFIAGAAIGSLVTWLAVKEKYRQIAQEEIDSVKEVFSRKREEPVEEKPKEEPKNDDYLHYVNVLDRHNYKTNTEKPAESPVSYIISPDEFGEMGGYNEVSLTYFADGVIADDDNEIVEDVGGFTTEDLEKHFGEYEEDSVYVRSDEQLCDYEILRSLKTYKEYMKTVPRPVEVR